MAEKHVAPYWVTCDNGTGVCVEESSPEEALREAREARPDRKWLTAERLPYPASPRLNTHYYKWSDGSTGAIPSFCFDPTRCKGRSSCPKRISCVE